MSDRICTMPDCGRKHCAHGLCKKHYYAAGYGYTPRPCSVVGCEAMTSAKSAKGFCGTHYARLLNTGTTADGRWRRLGLDVAEILWLRSEPHGDCILWTGAIGRDGYGSVFGAVWGTSKPHRFSWSLVNGPAPADMEVDHLCHNADPDCVPSRCLHRRCVNPEHLELVDHDENMRRQFARLASC